MINLTRIDRAHRLKWLTSLKHNRTRWTAVSKTVRSQKQLGLINMNLPSCPRLAACCSGGSNVTCSRPKLRPRKTIRWVPRRTQHGVVGQLIARAEKWSASSWGQLSGSRSLSVSMDNAGRVVNANGKFTCTRLVKQGYDKVCWRM